MKKIILVFCILLICGCSSTVSNNKSSSEFISTNEIQKIIDDNNYILLDVRTKDEYAEEHLVGSINIPYDEITSSVKLDKSKIILVYCRSGARAKTALNYLINLGYTVYNMGGIDSIDLPKE